MRRLRHALAGLLCILLTFGFAPNAWAFCGFYVAGADAKLYNQASQVAIAHNGNQTVMTMANDYQGDVANFALVVPVPTVIRQEQVKVVEPDSLTRLDSYSSPRLVTYPARDDDPCTALSDLFVSRTYGLYDLAAGLQTANGRRLGDSALGVTIEASFSVGEYDILILSAAESDGLTTWLTQNQYRIPDGASDVLNAYIRQGMKFFVAKVNLSELDRTGFQSLRPLQIAYDSPRFMLPIRLGMVNAQGPQDLLVYLLTPQGRVETTNYRTLEIPSNVNIPTFVRAEFGDFYQQVFANAHRQAHETATFVEYAWDLNVICDPCSADALTRPELATLGVSWVQESDNAYQLFSGDVFLTRLHVRYSRDRFPEDLTFQATANRNLFQGRYVMQQLAAPSGSLAQCSQETLQTLREYWEQSAEPSSRQDFATFVEDLLEPYSGYDDYPTYHATEDPEAYVQRFMRIAFLKHHRNTMTKLEQGAQNYSQLTGMPIDQVRRQISAYSGEGGGYVPDVWKRRYPPSA